jgi:2-aminoadipate transaminase
MVDRQDSPIRGPGLQSRAAERVLKDPSAAAIRDILNTSAAANVISFAGGVPAPDLIDRDGLQDAFARAVADSEKVFNYGATAGLPRLREALAELTRRRGRRCGPDEVLVTVGSQQGLDLAVAALAEPGQVVLVERPCYAAILQILSLAGVEVVGVGTDGEGIDPDALRFALETTGARVLYTNPTFQNPTGACASLDRRRLLVETAAEFGCTIIEDDAYGFLSHSGRPAPPALAALSDAGVVYVGSLSKIVSPGIRVGWVVCDPALLESMLLIKQARDLHTPTVSQAAAAEYVRSGRLETSLARAALEYETRKQAMVDLLPASLPSGTSWEVPDGGMYVWCTLPEGYDAGRLLEAGLAQGVAFVPGAPFFVNRPERAKLRLSFATESPARIAEGMARLAAAAETLQPDTATVPAGARGL